jgi:class 3 adenylate cyclase
MELALARHDAIARAIMEAHRGLAVKMTGDGVNAVFDDPLDAIAATLELQHALADPQQTHGVTLSMAMLRERLGGDEIARPMGAGAALDEDQACRIALEE